MGEPKFIEQAQRAEFISDQIRQFKKDKEGYSIVTRYKTYSDLNTAVLNVPNDFLRDVLLNQLKECGV